MLLKIDKGCLLIRDGFTHWPQARREYRFFKGAQNLPPRIVMVDGNGSLSFDVINWLSEQSIPLIRLDFQGNVISMLGNGGYAAAPEYLDWQIKTRNDPELRLEFCRNLICEKLTNSLKTLRDVGVDTRERSVALVSVEGAIKQLRTGDGKTVDDIRMIEARAASRYFAAWKGLPIKWRSRWKHPVPEDWLTIPQRGSLNNWTYVKNRNAKHPFNAMLNYAYGMMYSAVQIEVVSEGYDPRRGIMHHDRDDAFAWVLDAVEPRRPLVDAALFKFALSEEFTGADFVVTPNGVCRLGPQLAKVVAALTD